MHKLLSQWKDKPVTFENIFHYYYYFIACLCLLLLQKCLLICLLMDFAAKLWTRVTCYANLDIMNFSPFHTTGLQQYFELSPNTNITKERGSSLQIPCKVRNRQGECLWIHNGAGIGLIRSKYEFKRTPDNGKCVLFYVILGQIVFSKDRLSLLTLDKMATFSFSSPSLSPVTLVMALPIWLS